MPKSLHAEAKDRSAGRRAVQQKKKHAAQEKAAKLHMEKKKTEEDLKKGKKPQKRKIADVDGDEYEHEADDLRLMKMHFKGVDPADFETVYIGKENLAMAFKRIRLAAYKRDLCKVPTSDINELKAIWFRRESQSKGLVALVSQAPEETCPIILIY